MHQPSGRRILVATGTAHYQNLPGAGLADVPNEIEGIVSALSPEYERFAEIGLNPSITDLRKILPAWLKTLKEEDIAVLYYTGHGAHDGERFYLLTRDSDEALLDTTALPADELGRWIAKYCVAKQVLVILDACFSGFGATDLLNLAGKISNEVNNQAAVFAIAAARAKEEAKQEALSCALRFALTNNDGRLGGATQQFLALDHIIGAVNSYFERTKVQQVATFSCINAGESSRFFRNPRYRPQIQPGLDLESQRAFSEHWIPKAKGAELAAEGWYFTGRRTAVKEIIEWLAAEDSDALTRVVTGGPGSGKSALLAHLVTLSSPSTRKAAQSGTESELPPCIIDVAVHARRKTLMDVVRLVGEPLGIMANGPGELLMSLEKRQVRTVVLIDALDEADGYYEIILQLLKPLSAIPNVRILVGARPDSTGSARRFKALGTLAVEIDLDRPYYFDSEDIKHYVNRRLLCEREPSRQTPYRGCPELARTIAKGVAERSGKVFLVARTVVQTLIAASKVIDTSAPKWQQALPTGIDAAFEQFLSDADQPIGGGGSSVMVRAVLLPLAYAEGEGLPWTDVWSKVATALSWITVTDDDIACTLRYAAPFVVEALESGQSVYRLYHEEFASCLKRHIIEPDPEAAFAKALFDLIPYGEDGQRRWDRVHQPYLLTHFSTHAMKVPGLLDTIIVDPHYLMCVEPHRLLVSIERTEKGQHSGVATEMRSVIRLAHHHLRQCSTPGERAAWLETTAHGIGAGQVIDLFRLMNFQANWRVKWIHGGYKTVHVILEGHTSSVNAVALGERANGNQVIVSGSEDNTLRIWDLEGGALLGELWGHSNIFTVMTSAGCVNASPILVSGSKDNTVRLWDLETRLPLGELRGHEGYVTAVALGDCANGNRVVVSGSQDKTVRVWNLETQALLGELRGHEGPITSVALGRCAKGNRVVISGSQDNTVRVWDLETREPLGAPLRGHSLSVTAVAVGADANDHSLIVSGGQDKIVRIWDLESGGLLRELQEHLYPITAVAFGKRADGRPVIGTGSWDKTVRAWDLENGKLIGTLRGHEGAVTSVAFGERVDGRPVVISGSQDKTVRVWDLENAAPLGEPLRGHSKPITAIGLGLGANGRRVFVTGSEDKSVRVWDLENGAPTGEIAGHGYSITAVVCGEGANGRQIIVSGCMDPIVRVWDLENGELLRELRGHLGSIAAVALGERADGRQIIVSGSGDTTVGVWDFETGKPLGEIKGHSLTVTAVAIGKRADGRRVIVTGSQDKTVRIWDLESGVPLGELRGHSGPIASVTIAQFADGRCMVISVSWDEMVRVWDLEGGQLLSEYRSHLLCFTAITVRQRADGRGVIMSGGRDKTVSVWDPETGELLETCNLPWIPTLFVDDFVVIADQNHLAAVSIQNII